MKDANGSELAIGDTVEQNGQQFIVEAFDGDLVVCKWPPPAEDGFNFPSDPEGQPPRPFAPDLVRVNYVATDLVKV